MNLQLYLFEFLDAESASDGAAWKISLERCLDAIGYQYERFGEKIRIWQPLHPLIKSPNKDIFYRDGVEVFKVSMPSSYTKPVIGFNFSRLYFLKGETYPAFKSAAELFKNSGFPPVLRQIPLLNFLNCLIGDINHNRLLFAPLSNIEWKCVSAGVFIEGALRSSNVLKMSENQYASTILSMVKNQPAQCPASFEMTLIDAFVENKTKARQVSLSTFNVLVNEWGCALSKRRLSTKEDFEAWINNQNKSKIGFFALEGKKGQRPDQRAIEWMRAMEEAGIPYVLFSVSEDVNPIYTRHGNAMHLLAKAGGNHFRVNVRSIHDYQSHWFIGLDLGYGNLYKGKCAVVTLTDANGALICYWRALKGLDDTLQPELVNEALSWIINRAESLYPGQKFIVIRDGRCPQNEKIDVYRALLPAGRSVFIEYTKTNNPLMVNQSVQPEPGTLAIPAGSNQPFLFAAKASQKNMLTNTTRFRARINDIGYSVEQLGEILTAQCFSSKLSFQPSSLPAPIYWADGLASLSNVNLQFAGWGHLPSVTRDFR